MDEPGMASMFQSLIASGLQGFLGCSAVVYEEALVEFFANGRVRDGVVVSSVNGVVVEISEKMFAESFELPVDGFGDLSEMPKDAIFDARSLVSLTGEPISLSGRKNQMKMPFRLLCDIMAKAISVKAGSFNAITVEKFSLITAVVCNIKMNWAKYLFGVLVKMVSAKSKQAKGFAIQISLLLATFPMVELGESSVFPASKILSTKTVLRFVSMNNKDGGEEAAGVAKAKAVTKKRTAADTEAAVPKKKRTSKKRSISSLEMVVVAEEAVPVQQVAKSVDVEEPGCSSADAVDMIIQQVLNETRADDAPADTTEPAVPVEKNWFDLPYEDIVKRWEEEDPVVTASDTEDEEVAPADEVQQAEEVEAPIPAAEVLNTDETTSLDDILLSIPVDIPLPSTCMEVTQIKMGQMIKIPGMSENTWFLQSLPQIPAADKGKEVLVDKDPIQGNPAEEHFSLICADIDLLMYASAKNLIVRHQVASEFQQIKLRLDNISQSRQRFTETYNLTDEGSGPKTNNTRGDALLLEGTDVVGIEEPKKQITECLVQNDDGLKVISVVGMGGLGKTTLVKQIFDDASVKVSFDCHVWVLVSENFNLEKCLQNMISKLVNEVKLQPLQNLEAMSVDDMKNYVYKCLENKTYVIVLDDRLENHRMG
ncbi:hypothetical protein F511_31310 [Dorcoceras hygrometricum]|uniref:NB-ARC domain-containing protein n=1 Tax=Dorcoceras hygrometricum TaxID=472368 RepID=A0A2Z7A5Z2_9LAMI|nr:hypothetical protein F511_31310 [Dorcoceras hygrometricum]